MLMEEVVESKNLVKTYRKVVRNRGAAGIDEMTVDALKPYLQKEWPKIKEALVTDQHKPQPVRRVEIPKPGGKGTHMLGIPTVVDRLIQQALLQVLDPIFDPGFTESSYGFRAGRSAHQAVLKAPEYVASGKRWVVYLDLEKFFDRVNHDVLMARVARKVKDKRVMRLIRRYLQAGIMDGGLVEASREGTPQGGLCKALHKPPYAKSGVMQSKLGNAYYPGESHYFTLHNIRVISDLTAKLTRVHPCSNRVRCRLPDQYRRSQ